MAETIDDNVTFTYSSFLFTNELCEPIQFVIRPSETRVHLKPLIECGGGEVTCKLDPAIKDYIKILANGDACTSDDFFLPSYIEDCIAANTLLDKSGYRVTPSEQNKAMGSSLVAVDKTVKGRSYYTAEEDEAMLQYIAKHPYSYGGNAVWKKMELMKITSHPWQSMRYRFSKKLEPKLNRYLKERRRKVQMRLETTRTDGASSGSDDHVGNSSGDDEDGDESVLVRRSASDGERRADEEEEEEMEQKGAAEADAEAMSTASSLDDVLFQAADANSQRAKASKSSKAATTSNADATSARTDQQPVLNGRACKELRGESTRDPVGSKRRNLRSKAANKSGNNSNKEDASPDAAKSGRGVGTSRRHRMRVAVATDRGPSTRSSKQDEGSPEKSAGSFQETFLRHLHSSEHASKGAADEEAMEVEDDGKEEGGVEQGGEPEGGGDHKEEEGGQAAAQQEGTVVDYDATQIEAIGNSDEEVDFPARKRPKRTGSGGSSEPQEPVLVRLTPGRKKRKSPRRAHQETATSRSESEGASSPSKELASGRVVRVSRQLKLDDMVAGGNGKKKPMEERPGISTGGEDADTEASPPRTRTKRSKKDKFLVPESETDSVSTTDLLPMSRTRQKGPVQDDADVTTIPETQEFEVAMDGRDGVQEAGVDRLDGDCKRVVEELLHRFKLSKKRVIAALFMNSGDVAAAESFLGSHGHLWTFSEDRKLLSSRPADIQEMRRKHGEAEVSKRLRWLKT